jgi:hypothetical protein
MDRTPPSHARRTALAAVAIAAVGCTGQIGARGGSGPGGGNTGGPGGTGGPTTFGLCQASADPGPTPLVKLSTVQYRNTVRDLLAASGLADLAAEIAPALASVPDDSPETFRGLDTRISSDHLQAYYNVAAAVGNSIESTPARLRALAGDCATASSAPPLAASCVSAFLAGFGRRAFRRPLTADEQASFAALNDGVRPPATALRAMVVTLLLSPRFTNQLEIDGTPRGGTETDLALGPYEIASRLSYTFWQTMPDDGLLAAAADGSLLTDAGFAAALDRVFADPRTRQTLWQFWNEWFHLDGFTGFASDRPAFQALAAGENLGMPGHDHYGDMVQELHDLTDLYTWTRAGTLGDLLTSDLSVTPSADLAHLYGVPPWSGSGDYPRITDGSRAGILQRGALLVSSLEQTNPFHRGAFVRRSLLCDPLPRPDPNSLPPGSLDPPPPSPTDSTRQRYEKKIAGNDLCTGCHGQFADIGYVLEAFDSLGRFRTTEKVFDEQTGALLATLPVDSTAVPRIQLDDASVVAGPAALNQRIVASGKVDACLSGNYFRYALRREPATGSGDACLHDQITAALSTPAVGLAGAFRRLAEDPSFRRRKVATP